MLYNHSDQILQNTVNPVGCFDTETMNFKSGELKILSYRIIKLISFILSITPIISFIK